MKLENHKMKKLLLAILLTIISTSAMAGWTNIGGTNDFDEYIDSYYLKWQRMIPNSQLKGLLAPIWDEVSHVWTRDIFADVFKSIKKEKLDNAKYLEKIVIPLSLSSSILSRT